MKPRSALNRTLLTASGLVLLAGGLLVLFAGLDLYRQWHLPLPAAWPLASPKAVLLSSADRARWSSQGWWWWPAVITILTIITVLALVWLIAQLRRSHPGRMPVGPPHRAQGVELRDRALSDAIATEARHLPGVQKADAHITGTSQHPRNRIDLTLSPHGAPGRVLSELGTGPLQNARRSTGADRLATEVRLHVARHKPHRTR
ncbi:alkaline shock response membrane anchor protein AmaP [Streptomyces sp. NTH33]|uniref:alkaline shock response membrane anchor protein AmaP n=1 Tax=Streptomyces sp. NTH33 TaxID=1735453 RepID=UPI000DAA7AA2|nr:alkaline shock response membrane anchor protein AmaP [Streptomyces sp. NTH33]PZG83528.1 alkaline shock response membrane anchor protein AmaP [Streptomyces sp. NTH33]